MKLRLTQPGFATYSGQMGVIQFVDGVSSDDVQSIDAIRMAAVMLCEWADGSSPSIAQAILDHAHTPAPMLLPGEPAPSDTATTLEAPPSQSLPISQSLPVSYTEAQLAAIADRDGIKGLRVIGDPLGIKANSIIDLITAILAQAGVKA